MQKQVLGAALALVFVVPQVQAAPGKASTKPSAASPAPSTAASLPTQDAEFDKLVDQYYAEYPAAHPVAATALGLHDKDGELDDVTESGVLRELERILGWRNRFLALDRKKLSDERAADFDILLQAIESERLELSEVRGWRRYANSYPSLATQSVYVIIKRSFAPEADRLRSVIAREKKIPALLETGRHNLQGVAKSSVEIALAEIGGIKAFFRDDVPRAFPTVKDPALLAELKQSTDGVLRALDAYKLFLEKELLPKANAPFAIGEVLFKKKLLADEMIDTDLDTLLKQGEAELKRLQEEFKKTAAKIDPKRSYTEVQDEMSKDHPSADKLISEVRGQLAMLKKFVTDKKLVTIPSEILPKVEETPPFMQAMTMASMETPGPFETKATEAYYNVTVPIGANWKPAEAEDFLRGAFSRPVMLTTSVHEAYPGHYTQFLWLPKVASKVRKYETAASNAEGWAHYCEQLMLDEGFGNGDPKTRLGQLQDALLRAARFVVGIRMHTRGMTMDEATEFFHKEGMQAKRVALQEVRRGTQDPTYLYYTYGKLELFKLRDEYKKKLGSKFTLAAFHDAFLAEGAAHLPIVRRRLLGTATK